MFSLAVLLLAPACGPGPQPPSDESLRKEIEGLKKEVTSLKEKLAQLESGQKAILDHLKKPGAPPEAGAPAEALPLPAVAPPLTVSQLIANKDRYLGTRVTVRGPVGPVLVHHKSLLLKSPEGLVEVYFGKLPDEKVVQRLLSSTLDQPITVTGMVRPSPKGGAKLEIDAEAVEF